MSALLNISANSLQAGDLYLGNYVPYAPTRPLQPFANAWVVERVTRTEGAVLRVLDALTEHNPGGKHRADSTLVHPVATVHGSVSGTEFDLAPLRPTDRVLVLR
jgi:hypothetical protein